MSSKNKFLKKGLCVVGSSVATAGSLFSAAGVEAVDNVVSKKQLNEALSKNFWYIILNFFNFGGVLQEKIEKIKKEQLEKMEELEKNRTIGLLEEKMKKFSNQHYIHGFFDIIDSFVKDEEECRSIKSQMKCSKKEKNGPLYVVCYDDETETYNLLEFVNHDYESVCTFCKKGSSVRDAEEFYGEFLKVFFEDEYNKSEEDFCDFLDKESSIEEKKGLFKKTVFHDSLIYDFNFDCFIGKNKLSYVLLKEKDQEITDFCVVYNSGQKGSSGRYRAGEEGLSKGEMAMYLKDIMEQAKKYKQGKNTGSVDNFNSIVNSDSL